MKKSVVALTKNEHDELTTLTSKGRHKSQKILNALILLNCDRGEFQKEHSNNEEITCLLNVSMRKIDRVKKRLVEGGYDTALNDEKGSSLYASKIDGDFEAHLVALSGSEPAEGYARGLYSFCQIESLNSIISIASPQALATKEVGDSFQTKQRFRRQYGDGVGRL